MVEVKSIFRHVISGICGVVVTRPMERHQCSQRSHVWQQSYKHERWNNRNSNGGNALKYISQSADKIIRYLSQRTSVIIACKISKNAGRGDPVTEIMKRLRYAVHSLFMSPLKRFLCCSLTKNIVIAGSWTRWWAR